jgi:hypothetical protein
MASSSKVEPKEITKSISHEWAQMNGVCLQIKELQSIDSKTVVSFYKVSKLTPKDVILVKITKILIRVQDMAKEDGLEDNLWDFSMDINVPISKILPEMLLRVLTAKLRGEDLSTFNRLNNRVQFAQKTWHSEVASKYATKMKGLVQMAKDYGIVEQFWGVHVHLREVTDISQWLERQRNR